jgi:chromosome partitioning protein
MARILAISNQKGGVGKTTTAVNLAASLARYGQRVLLVDLDPQGNASSGLGAARVDMSMGVYDALLEYREAEDVRVPTSLDRLDLMPATADLVGAEVELVSAARREHRLRRALQSLRDEYDWVLIDCPPSLGLLTINALTAADAVLVPLQAEYYAMEGLGDLVRTIMAVQRGLNPDLRREGIVITMSDTRNKLSREVERQARALFGAEVFDTVIPRNVRLGEAPSHGRSIVEYDARSQGAVAYLALAAELLRRHGVAVSDPLPPTSTTPTPPSP